ncbi:MAG: putative lipid II flippase FtsW [Firmicutes bacterium]|nr:putative lipid II flippase FtsW [Bacillota bacterium]
MEAAAGTVKKTVKRKKRRMGSADFSLVALTCALVIFGVIMVFSASYYWSIDKFGDPYNFLIKDLFWAGTGFIIMLATTIIDYHAYKRIAVWLMLGSVLLLVAVLFVGITLNGAQRWIQIGPITLMPGEICKLCIIIFTAWFLCRDPRRIHDILHGILPLLMLAGLCGLLILKQPNMSTAITVVGIVMAMMFVAGLKWQYVAILFFGAITGGVALIIKGGGYRLQRAVSFLDPFADPLGDGYQVCQGLLALGSGGLRGLGLGHSIQKNLYLPEPQNDFILAIIGEELGFIGVLVLMLVYLCLIYRGIKVVLQAPDRFGMLLGSGIVMMIGIQVLLNVAVVTSSMPPTGITLPFVSYGGNALWMFMGSMGILLNISRQIKKPEDQKPQAAAPAPRREPLIHPSAAERDLSKIRNW